MSYKEKYLKYKAKYLNIKNLVLNLVIFMMVTLSLPSLILMVKLLNINVDVLVMIVLK